MSLTDAQVTAIRTSGLTDRYWADKLRVHHHTVRNARIGASHRHVPITPDTAPRDGTGRRVNSQPVRAKPRRQRPEWLR